MRADIQVVRQNILDAAKAMIASSDLTPGNRLFHDARYRLYDIAATVVDAETFAQLTADTAIHEAARSIFPISCRAGIAEECTIARELLARTSLSFDDIFSAYYGSIYQAMMESEMAYLDTLPQTARRAFYIGGGAMPVPAMLLAIKAGFHVTIIDADTESCTLAKALIARIGLSDRVTITQSPAETADYTDADIVWIANWVSDKDAVFQRIRQFPNVTHVIARTAAADTLSFIINNRIDDRAICRAGYDIAFRTEKQPNLSLTSIIFKKRVHTTSHRKVDSILELIGNTPILRLDPAKTGLKNIELYAKLEHLNPFGSVKDRTALAMLGPHIQKLAKEGRKVLELSSGNAARALQAIASIYGTSLETVSSRIRLHEIRKLLQLQGARVTPINHLVDPDDAYSALHIVDKKAHDEADTYFYTDQYRNPANVGTHADITGREILEDLGTVDYFFGAIGTAGSSVGVANTLKTANTGIDISGIVSGTEDFVPGIRHQGEIFNVGPFDEKLYNRILDCSAQQAIDGVLDLIRLYGVMAGPSSGAAYHAALRHLRTIDGTLAEKRTAVFIVCDRVEPYLSYIEERRPGLFSE